MINLPIMKWVRCVSRGEERLKWLHDWQSLLSPRMLEQMMQITRLTGGESQDLPPF